MKDITTYLLLSLFLSVNLFSQTNETTENEYSPEQDKICEAKLLLSPDIKDFAKRVGDTLFLKFLNGKTQTIVNSKLAQFEEAENGKKVIRTMDNYETGRKDTVYSKSTFFLFGSVCAGKYFLLKSSYIMESEFLIIEKFRLINKANGTEITNSLIANPQFSSDNVRFIELFLSAVDGDEPEIKVSSITNDEKIKVELEFKFDLWYAKSVVWISNTEFKINKDDNEKDQSPVIYKWNGTKWVLGSN